MTVEPEHRTTSLGSLTVGPLCLGANVFGWYADAEATCEILDAFTAAGGDFVDTAALYGEGRSETYIGDWLAGRGRRDDVVVATKIGHPSVGGLRPATIRAAVEDSLRRLRTDRIDLLYTHVDDESVEVGEIITALDGLVREGKVREIGASNISPERLAASLSFAATEGKAEYVALQPNYSLMSRDTYEGPLADLAEQWAIAVFPYFSLASGFLTGKHRPGVQVDSQRSDRVAGYVDSDRGRKVLAALDAIAAAHGAEQASVALAWLSSRRQVAAPIASARKLEQLPALLAAASLDLTDVELAQLTDASA